MNARMRNCLCAALLSLAAAVSADDERVVPAHEEPRHVPKLVNDWVRIIDVEIPEGEQTLYHAHTLDYPYLMITSVTLNNQVHGQSRREVAINAGDVGYYRASTQGTYTHRFINKGPGTFRAIGIELLRPLAAPARVALPLADRPGFRTVIDNERVRAWRVTLAPGESLGPIAIPGPSIRVAISEGRLAESVEGRYDASFDLAPAQFVFRDGPATSTLRNAGAGTIELAIFSLN
jgi:hypothetical protein